MSIPRSGRFTTGDRILVGSGWDPEPFWAFWGRENALALAEIRTTDYELQGVQLMMKLRIPSVFDKWF